MLLSVGIIHGEAQLAIPEQTISQGFVIWGQVGKRKERVIESLRLEKISKIVWSTHPLHPLKHVCKHKVQPFLE